MQKTERVRDKRTENIILLVLGTLTAIGPLSIDMYLPSFDRIADYFQTTQAQVGFSLTSYFIGISVGQLVYGPIMDKFGRKKPLLIGLVIYILAALSCFYSPSIWWLIVSRLFLALGASGGMVAAKAVVRDVFPPEEVARAISFLMLIMGAAPIIAPTLGGLILVHFSWQVIFLTLAIIASLMFVSTYFLLPDQFTPDKSVELNIKDILKKYKGIFQDKIFFTFSLAGGLTVGAMFAYISKASGLFMGDYGMTESEFAILFGVNASGLILGSQLNRFLLKRIRTYELTLKISYFLIALSAILVINGLSFQRFDITIVTLYFVLFLLGFQNPNTTALSLYPFVKKAGRASALVGSLKMFLGALTSYIVSLFVGQNLLPLAIVVFISFVISCFLLLRFKFKEKEALTHIMG
ncbi:MAG: multidrug effflux MFS transporter [Flavobacteriaceae bacterium]|nr:multidrug effflux MFS transporter [Psychroflexus sp.]